MVIEHEAMHQETLLYMIQAAPSSMKQRLHRAPQYRFELEPAGVEIAVPRGETTLGSRFDALPLAGTTSSLSSVFLCRVLPWILCRSQTVAISNLFTRVATASAIGGRRGLALARER